MPRDPSAPGSLQLPLASDVKELISAAAAASECTVEEFVLRSAIDRAHQVLDGQRMFVLDANEWDAFKAILDAPASASPGLKRLLEVKAPWER